MSAIPTQRFITPEEYLVIDDAAEYKSEYYDGEIVAMSGASPDHESLAANLTRDVGNAIRRGPCRQFTSNLRIKTPGAPQGMDHRRLNDVLSGKRSNYLYSDLTIVCGEPRFEVVQHIRTLLNPTVIFEILSDSTERRDRGVKWSVYQQLESVSHYVIISQWEPRVEIFTRQENGDWSLHTETDPAGSFTLSAVDVTIAMADLYEGVPLEPGPTEQSTVDEPSAETESRNA
jgi:Uma2 family endonuclease